MRKLLRRWLGIEDHELRIYDVERHFVTRRDKQGTPTETLAEVPIEKRKELQKGRTAGMNWTQRRRWLEATDGGTREPITERLPSTS